MQDQPLTREDVAGILLDLASYIKTRVDPEDGNKQAAADFVGALIHHFAQKMYAESETEESEVW